MIERPALSPWAGRDSDPSVLRQSADGYSSIMPSKTRAPRPKKPDFLAEMLAKAAEEQRSRDVQREAAVFSMMDAPGTQYVLAIEDWNAEHHLEVGIAGREVHMDDCSFIELICSCVLPVERRGQRISVHLRFGGAAVPADEREPEIGSLDFGHGRADLQIAEHRAAYVCAALAAGKLRTLDLETIEGCGEELAIRWAKLCTRTHDGDEDARENSRSRKI